MGVYKEGVAETSILTILGIFGDIIELTYIEVSETDYTFNHFCVIYHVLINIKILK